MKFLLTGTLLLLSLFLAEGLLRKFLPAEAPHPCREKVEGERHRYRPECRAEKDFSTNEDGLRDRPRKFFAAKKTVLVLGGNNVEGIGLPAESTLPRQLEVQLPSWTFLNGGQEGASPTQLRIQAERYAAHYPLRAVLLVINETDVAQERLAQALASRLDETGAPVKLGHYDSILPSWLDYLQKRSSSRIVSYLAELHLWQERKRLVHTQELREEIFCSGIKSLARLNLPVFTLAVPVAAHSESNQRLSLPNDPIDFTKMIECAKKHSRAVWDLRSTLINRGVPIGMGRGLSVEVAKAVAEELKPLLGSKLPTARSQKTQ